MHERDLGVNGACHHCVIEKTYDLSRFIEAHEKDYQKALKELRAGYKPPLQTKLSGVRKS